MAKAANDGTEALAVRVKTAARLLDISPFTLRQWLRSGRLRGVKLGAQWRVYVADVEALLDE